MRIDINKNIISNINFWFFLFAFLSFLLAVNKIIIHIGFIIIPLAFILTGMITYFFKPKISLYLFVFLLPLITAFPYFNSNGFPYNYMAIPLFYLSGIIIGSVMRKEEMNFNNNWSIYYLFFLIIIWLSAVFVFLRWSNFTLNLMAFLKDTPVEPGLTRVSFASIFTVLTLFLFSISHYIIALIKKNNIKIRKIFYYLIPGYTVSVFISLYQMFVDHYFLKMKMKVWIKDPDQFSGGFSDFNSYGFFSGVIFLLFFIFVIDYLNKNESKLQNIRKIIFCMVGLFVSLVGILVSGSRTAFIFIIASFALFILSKQIKFKIKVIFLIIFIVFAFTAGGVLKERIINTVEKFNKSFISGDFLQGLDRASNGRVQMFQNSSMILKKYPVSGVGTGGFLFYLKDLKYKQKYYEDLPLNHYLLIFDEGGFIGLFAFLMFLIAVIKNFKNKSYIILLITIYIALFVNNFFWFPEALIIFWIIIAIGEQEAVIVKPLKKYKLYIGIVMVLIFIFANIITFSKLHPVNLLAQKNILYDYGFWKLEKDNNGNNYNWSKSEAGIYLSLSKDGVSKKIKVFCGAPLSHLKDKSQNLKIFWKGKLFKEINFKKNKFIEFIIKDKNQGKGFLEFRVSPAFNLKKLGLSNESRNLGVQVYCGRSDV